jgi:hypothetical protein
MIAFSVGVQNAGGFRAFTRSRTAVSEPFRLNGSAIAAAPFGVGIRKLRIEGI